MNIFVAKLSYSTTEEDLKALFAEYGTVDSAKIIYDKYENRSKGFGFVDMDRDSEAINAIEALNGAEVDGRMIVVKKARPKPSSDSYHDRGMRG